MPEEIIDFRADGTTVKFMSNVYQKCKASEKTDLVTGEKKYNYCMVERMNGGDCKPEGLNFQLNIPDEEGVNHGE